MDPQVVDHLVFEKESGHLDLWSEEALGGGSEWCDGERGVGEVALRGRREADP